MRTAEILAALAIDGVDKGTVVFRSGDKFAEFDGEKWRKA